jgi:tetratricopeptide (TPR) repeat protein
MVLEHAASVTPDNAVAHNNLGTIYLQQGNWDEAGKHFAAAVRAEPRMLEHRLNLGTVLAHQGKFAEAMFTVTNGMSRPHEAVCDHLGTFFYQEGKIPEAIEQFRAALAINPEDFDAHHALAVLAIQQKQFPEAISQFEASGRLRPGNLDLQIALANALADGGRINDAVTLLQAVVRLNPAHIQTREALGQLRGLQGKASEAEAQFLEAIRLSDAPEAHYHLALAYLMQGKAEAAAEQYRLASSLKPDWPDPLNDLAWMRATYPKPELRNGAEAVRLAERACSLTSGKEAKFLGTLDAAYAEAGRFTEALTTAEQARKLALDSGDQSLAAAAAERLALYRAGQPYRQRAGF